MLTNIFSRRYENVQLRSGWYEEDRRFMVQSLAMLRNLFWTGGPSEKVPVATDASFKTIHDAVALELGYEFLSDRYWWHRYTVNGNQLSTRYEYDWLHVCKAFLTKQFDGKGSADQFIKDRLSLVEQGFRNKYWQVQYANSTLEQSIIEAKFKDAKRKANLKGMGALGLDASVDYHEQSVRTANDHLNAGFKAAVHELNERLRLAKYKLHFHNGFIQIAEDETTNDQIAKPFWSLVSGPQWNNVDLQMKEAIDRRDTGDRTAAFHAVSALESVVKIISDLKGWTHGGEKGAANYIDNLGSKKNGSFIKQWEADMLKSMFSDVRNPFAHGPGQSTMPSMSKEQTDWALDTAMAWTKSLIQRM